MTTAIWLLAVAAGAAAIVWGAEQFAEHLSGAARGLGVSTVVLAILLAGAEPEELATAVTASARHAPGIAFGDVIGANIAICLVALGVGAVIAPLVFGRTVRVYALIGLPLAALAAVVAWDGHVGRPEGALLVGLYGAYVATIWLVERRPPTLGETAELVEDRAAAARSSKLKTRVGRDLALVLLGLMVMSGGAVLLVEAVRRLSGSETSQTNLGLTLVGFATAFELVALAWSISRRGASEAAVAAVVGSLTYNVTMTLGVAALVRPLRLVDSTTLHGPLVVMLAAMAFVTLLGVVAGRLDRRAGVLLLVAYPVFVTAVLLGI
ncbi:MAG: sodium:calcium antiporter [Actinomycetota bacterium]|nr:sodium:calcium antiporter [Actinomycetota bacterium]